MRSASLACAVALLAACVTQHRITVTGSALQQEVVALRDTGTATVIAEDLRDGEDAYTVREVIRTDQVIGAADEPHRVADLIRGCAPMTSDCALSGMNNVPLRVRELETRSVKPVLRGVLTGVILGGAIATVACGIACDEGTTARDAANVSAVVYGVALVGGLTYLAVSCLRGGCRD